MGPPPGWKGNQTPQQPPPGWGASPKNTGTPVAQRAPVAAPAGVPVAPPLAPPVLGKSAPVAPLAPTQPPPAIPVAARAPTPIPPPQQPIPVAQRAPVQQPPVDAQTLIRRVPTLPPALVQPPAAPAPAPVVDEPMVFEIERPPEEPAPKRTAAPVAEKPKAPLVDVEAEELLEEAPILEELEPEADQISTDQWAAALEDLQDQITKTEPHLVPVDLSPLSFKDAVAAIGEAKDRDAVARTVLRYARSRASRAVLLSVQGDVALGWDAIGEDLTLDIARRIAFPLGVPSAFRLVRESRSHYIGPLGKDSGNVRFLKLAGKKWPASAVLLPVLFRGRVVYILYVDNGHKKHVDADVGELMILSQNITRSMEQMVDKRQQKGT